MKDMLSQLEPKVADQGKLAISNNSKQLVQTSCRRSFWARLAWGVAQEMSLIKPFGTFAMEDLRHIYLLLGRCEGFTSKSLHLALRACR